MAYTNPNKTWGAATLSSSDLNVYLRDNMTEVQVGLNGDGSSDDDTVHLHKSGAAGSAPPAASTSPLQAGRLYGPDGQLLIQNNAGTGWHTVGHGPYDDFLRGTLGSASASGHPIAAESGTFTISSNRLMATSGGMWSLNTRTLLTRSYTVRALFNAASGSNDFAIIGKFASTSNFIYATMVDTNNFTIYKVIGGVTTAIAGPLTLTLSDGLWWMELDIIGTLATARVWRFNVADMHITQIGARDADVQHANLATATKVGIRLPNTIDDCRAIDVRF